MEFLERMSYTNCMFRVMGSRRWTSHKMVRSGYVLIHLDQNRKRCYTNGNEVIDSCMYHWWYSSRQRIGRNCCIRISHQFHPKMHISRATSHDPSSKKRRRHSNKSNITHRKDNSSTTLVQIKYHAPKGQLVHYIGTVNPQATAFTTMCEILMLLLHLNHRVNFAVLIACHPHWSLYLPQMTTTTEHGL